MRVYHFPLLLATPLLAVARGETAWARAFCLVIQVAFAVAFEATVVVVSFLARAFGSRRFCWGGGRGGESGGRSGLRPGRAAARLRQIRGTADLASSLQDLQVSFGCSERLIAEDVVVEIRYWSDLHRQSPLEPCHYTLADPRLGRLPSDFLRVPLLCGPGGGLDQRTGLTGGMDDLLLPAGDVEQLDLALVSLSDRSFLTSD
jgi:hypothetical protein